MNKKLFDEDQELEVVNKYNNGAGSTALAKVYSCSESTIVGVLKRHKIPIRGIGASCYNAMGDKVTFFNTIDTEEKAYWLGFITADGHVSTKRGIVETELSGKDKVV